MRPWDLDFRIQRQIPVRMVPVSSSKTQTVPNWWKKSVPNVVHSSQRAFWWRRWPEGYILSPSHVWTGILGFPVGNSWRALTCLVQKVDVLDKKVYFLYKSGNKHARFLNIPVSNLFLTPTFWVWPHISTSCHPTHQTWCSGPVRHMLQVSPGQE